MGAKRLERQRYMQGSHMLLQQEQEEDRRDSAKIGRWNHLNAIGGLAAKAVKEPTKDELQNRVQYILFI